MKTTILIAVFLLFFSCKKSVVEKSDLNHLNGYWEIAEVRLPDGNKKQYGMSPTIDFIALDKMQGYRKKMQPKFNGSYSTSNATEEFTIEDSGEVFVLRYATDLNTWEEQILHIDSTSFTVQSEDGIQYLYKRFTPITIPQ